MKGFSSFVRLLSEVGDILAPRRCALCGKRLMAGEDFLCLSCLSELPFTRYFGRKGNPVERLFWARIPVARANAYLFYFPESMVSRLFLSLKYGNRSHYGQVLGAMMAAELSDTDFFDGVDAIVPVPLAQKRLRQRGYNQSEKLAEGISSVTHLPIFTRAVERVVANPTQTQLTRAERRENVADVFMLSRPELLAGKHLLLVDDILTTGSTLMACAEEMAKAGDVKISILTLGLAGKHGEGPELHPETINYSREAFVR